MSLSPNRGASTIALLLLSCGRQFVRIREEGMPVKTGHATITVRQRGVHQDAGAECGEEGLREGTMRKLATASIAYLLAACAQSPPTADPPKEQPQVGRYVIVHSPQIERDTVLLDTA